MSYKHRFYKPRMQGSSVSAEKVFFGDPSELTLIEIERRVQGRWRTLQDASSIFILSERDRRISTMLVDEVLSAIHNKEKLTRFQMNWVMRIKPEEYRNFDVSTSDDEADLDVEEKNSQSHTLSEFLKGSGKLPD